MTTVDLVGLEYDGPCRRVGGRRACDEQTTRAQRRGELVSNRVAAHVEIELIEVQCAVDAALERAGHSIAAQKLLDNELRALRAALRAARVASRTATSHISGAEA